MGIMGLAWVLIGLTCNFFCKRILLDAVSWLLKVGPALRVWRLLIMMFVSKLLLSQLDANAIAAAGRIFFKGNIEDMIFFKFNALEDITLAKRAGRVGSILGGEKTLLSLFNKALVGGGSGVLENSKENQSGEEYEVNVKSRRNKNKKDVNADGVCNEVLDSQNDEHVEKMDDSQTGLIRETIEVEKDMNDVNKVNEEVEGTDMATESDNSRNSQNADSQKDNDEGKKFSYAKIVNNSSLDNKLNLIPTEVNDDGIEVVIFDEDIVNEGSKKWELIVCGYFVGYKMPYQEMRYNITRMWGKFRFKSVIPNGNGVFLFKFKNNEGLQSVIEMGPWMVNGKLISKGISAIASRLGTPLIMDQFTTNMCNLGNGRPGFARVLVDVEAGKCLPEKIDIVYKNKERVVTENKSVNVNYDWAPPMCTCCKVFGHNDKNYGSRPRTVDEFMEEERNTEIVEKGNSKSGEKTSHGNGEFQMNEKGNFKTNWNTNAGGSEQLNGEINAKRKNNSVSQNQARNKNKFDVLREYDGNEIQENDKQNEVEEIEEDDVFECSGMANSMKENKVIGLDSNVCATLETHLKSKKLSKACDKAFGKWNWISNVHLCISFVSFVYAANGSIERRNIWANLNRHKQITTGKPWIIGGDMNVILNTNEHSTRVSFVSSEMQEFKDCVKLIEVKDLCSSGLFFTWTKNIKKAGEGDETSVLKNLAVIIIPNSMKRKKKAFKFANFVVDKESFIPTVEKGWKIKVDGLQMFQLVKKMRSLKIHLRKLNWQNGNLFEKVEEVRDELMNIQRKIDKDPYNKTLRNAEVAILKEYMTIMEDEEKLLFQKSKFKWLSLGDRNNSFFHKTLKGRYQRNRIERVQDVNGKSFERQEVDDQYNKISDVEALSLVEDVSSKEIKDALFDIGDNKAPGPDGRQIQDNILLTQELLKGYDRKGGPSIVAFKIDIQKAYDTVNWSFLETILTHFGFHEKMINWIMICVKTTSFTINVNGELCGFFKGGRGLRQGDPICKSMKITHVCFVDDLLVLCHGDAESVKAVRDSIDKFGKCSGLLPNFNKSTIFLVISKAKIAWKKMYKPKSHGGLRLKDLEIWNKALLKTKYPIMRHIKVPKLNTEKGDWLVWKNKDGKECKFSIKEVYKDMRIQSSKTTWAKLIWFSQCIPKRSFMLWMAIQGKLMTCDRMAKWVSYDMHVCALCKGNVESHDHLFFNCLFSQAIWKELKILMQFQSNANVWGDIIDELAEKPNNSSIWSIVRRLCLAGAVYAI
ncbi:RNA-directed DNA polymerase, eukaryota, reverse transcriptase zinc-binding domain protein [Tanacetum coccineum]|uniref:RNA-directed DNA polymerase, eukaryota, reverse transcriptase zinc-binding domain protein n=1 Tax=Tanacetum coccineum TaxID=301880 RepID=A0ABQ5HNY8_9ASTR